MRRLRTASVTPRGQGDHVRRRHSMTLSDRRTVSVPVAVAFSRRPRCGWSGGGRSARHQGDADHEADQAPEHEDVADELEVDAPDGVRLDAEGQDGAQDHEADAAADCHGAGVPPGGHQRPGTSYPVNAQVTPFCPDLGRPSQAAGQPTRAGPGPARVAVGLQHHGDAPVLLVEVAGGVVGDLAVSGSPSQAAARAVMCRTPSAGSAASTSVRSSPTAVPPPATSSSGGVEEIFSWVGSPQRSSSFCPVGAVKRTVSSSGPGASGVLGRWVRCSPVHLLASLGMGTHTTWWLLASTTTSSGRAVGVHNHVGRLGEAPRERGHLPVAGS